MVQILSGYACMFKESMSSIINSLSRLTSDHLERIQPEYLEWIYLQSEHIKDYLKNVEGVILQLIENGEQFSGVHKKVTYGKRVWKDEKKVKQRLKHLKDKLLEPPKLKTPAQLEKLAGRKNIDDLVDKPRLVKLAPGAPDNPFINTEVGK
jgi:hypothetical protein